MWCFSPAAKVARGGHGGGLRSITTAAAVPALLSCRWKKEAGGPGEPKGRVGLLAAGQLGRKKKSFQNKIWIFEFIKVLKICTRRFRRNLDTKIFPKFF
jgi:hypothetical protein